MEVDLGRFFLCLSVGDVSRSLEFYEKLGFQHVEGEDGKDWAVVERGDLRLGLFNGKAGKNLLNFLDGSVLKIFELLKERGVPVGAELEAVSDDRAITTVEDPDGNLITFAGDYESWVKPIKCPRCKKMAESSGRRFSFGVFEGRSYFCEPCGKSFNAFFRDRKLNHTVPKPKK
jgi:catechol 2,3-dioxygenase-like lactoylglutathione lyase family enzyme